MLKDTQYKRGMIVECLDSRLGTISGVGGDSSAPVLEVRPDKRQGSKGPLRIPQAYIAQTLENTVLLNISCEEAERIGRDTSRRAAASAPTVAVERPWRLRPRPRCPARRRPPSPSRARRPANWPAKSLTMPLMGIAGSGQELAGGGRARTAQDDADRPAGAGRARALRGSHGGARALQRVLDEADHPAPRQEGDTLVVPIVHKEIVVVRRARARGGVAHHQAGANSDRAYR